MATSIGTHSRLVDNDQNRQFDIFQSSELCPDWWVCNGRVSARTASQRPALSNLTDLGCRPVHLPVPNPKSYLTPADNVAPVHSIQSDWICLVCNPRQPVLFQKRNETKSHYQQNNFRFRFLFCATNLTKKFIASEPTKPGYPRHLLGTAHFPAWKTKRD